MIQKKNHKLGDMRLSTEMNELLLEIASQLGFRKTDLARLLLMKSLKQLKGDIARHGLQNLEFQLTPFSSNGQNGTKS